MTATVALLPYCWDIVENSLLGPWGSRHDSRRFRFLFPQNTRTSFTGTEPRGRKKIVFCPKVEVNTRPTKTNFTLTRATWFATRLPLTGALELMEEVLDSQEKEGLRPLKLKRFRRKDLLLLLLSIPMLVCESDIATRLPPSSLLVPQPVGWLPVVEAATASTAARARMRSSGVITGSAIVPIQSKPYQMYVVFTLLVLTSTFVFCSNGSNLK